MSTLAALVTGGGGGIGKAIAVRLAKNQPVLVVGRDETRLRETCQEITAQGGEATYVAADLAEENAMAKIRQGLLDKDWEVSNLILNAAIWDHGRLKDFSDVLFQQMLQVNVVANWRLLKLVLPSLEARNSGTVVFNCGIVGIKAFGQDAAYVATKHALFGIASSLTAEYRGRNIRFVPFCTSFVEGDRTTTTIQEIAARKKADFESTYERIGKQTPAGHIISLAEFSEAVASVCDPAVPVESGVPVTFTPTP